MMNENKNNNEPDLSIILPTYNESLTIEKMLDAVVIAVPPRINTEVLVIDDDSPDGTSKIVNSYIQNQMVLFRLEFIQGKVSEG